MKPRFKQRVLEVVRRIPKGKVLTYKEVAQRAGSPRAWRAVGNILHRNTDPRVPCHRVVRSNREVGGYRKGTNKKISLLKREGIAIKNKKVVE